MKKRFLSALLAFCIMLTLVPAKALAATDVTFPEPKVTSLNVTYDGGEPVELLGYQPTISMPAGTKPVFTVTFDSAEQLNAVYVTSTKDGETKYLEAKSQGNKYVTDGYFDPDNHDYIPGTIAVTYSKKVTAVTEDGTIDGTSLMDSLKDQLASQGISIENVEKDDNGDVTAQMVLGEMFGEMGDVYIDVAISEFWAGAGVDQEKLDSWLGVYKNLAELSSYDLTGANGNKFTLYLSDKDFTDIDTYLVLIKDGTSNKFTKMLVSKAEDKFDLDGIADTMDNINFVTKLLYDYKSIGKDMNSLREEVNGSPLMNAGQKQEAYAKIAALENDKKLFLMGMTAITILTKTMPLAGPAGLVFSALVAGISVSAGYFWENRIGMVRGCEPIENVFEDSNDHGAGWIKLTTEYIQEHTEDVYEAGFYLGSVFYIEESGNYYLPEDAAGSQILIGNSNDEPIEVTLCLHGHQLSSVMRAHSNGILQIRDCKYKEHEDGSVTGGTITNTIRTSKRGKVYINSGIVKSEFGGRQIFNEGEVILNGGTIIENNSNDSAIYSQEGGKITINGGSIVGGRYGIYADGRNEIIINDGTITGNGMAGIWINSGIVTINGGAVSGTPWMIQNKYDNTSDVITTITGGSHSGEIGNNGGTVLVSGGKIAGTIRNTAGTVTVSGGEISDYDSAIWNLSEDGIVNVTGGALSGISDLGTGSAIKNEGGIINVSGGTITGYGNRPGIDNNSGQVTVSNGKITGSGCISGGEVTLCIASTSNIELDGKYSTLGSAPEIIAASGYTGGVTYYSTPNAAGIKQTIDELAQIDWSLPYARFEGDNAVSNIPDPCEHEYTAAVTPPTCTGQGYTTYTCSLCGTTYTDNYVTALGHSYGEWIITREPTETLDGQRERTCSVCGDKQISAIPATGTPANEPKPLFATPGTINHASTIKGNTGVGYLFEYDEHWFLKESTEYNHDLAKMSLVMAMAAYGRDGKNGVERERDIKDLFKQLHFEEENTLFEYKTPTADSIGYAIGSKLVTDGTNTFTLIAVAVRGGGYEKEWASNFTVGFTTEHQGFRDAASTVVAAVEDYIEKNDISTNIKLWMTGYSRAGATVNIAARTLDVMAENHRIPGLSRDNIFAYCFECPQTVQGKLGQDDNSDVTSDVTNNIFNIVNHIDIVTKVAPSSPKWDYTRYGITYYLPSAEQQSVGFSDAYKKMQNVYSSILSYEMDKGLISPMAEQGAFLNDMVDAVATFFDSPDTYAAGYQNEIRNILLATQGKYEVGTITGAFCEGLPAFAILHPVITKKLLSNLSNIGAAHHAELCYAWMNSISGKWDFVDAKTRQLRVNCPVDVNVYNSDHTLVAQIVNDEVVELENSTIVAYIDENGQKVVVLPTDDEFTVKVLATDNGEMSYQVTEYDVGTGVTSRVVNYYEVPIETGDELLGTIEKLEDVLMAEYPLVGIDGERISTSVDLSGNVPTYLVTVGSSGNGTVSGGGRYTVGEFAKVTATANSSATFLGWYVDNSLISVDAEYRFLVDKNINVTAKFTQDTTIPDTPITPDPSYPSGGSTGESPAPKTHGIIIPTVTGGSVTATPKSASKGSTVTLTATPNKGYELASLTITDSKGNELELKNKGNNQYTFTMPNSNVTVSTTFAPVSLEPTNPTESTSNDEPYLFPFTDVLKTDWFCGAVEYVFNNDLMTGTAPYTFDPQGKMSRAMVWTVLGRMADADVDGSVSPWYAKAQAWATTNNVSDGTNPDNSISRQELMTMLWRYVGSPAATADLSKFSDSGAVAEWANGAMQWAVSTGLLVGDNGRLNPASEARRCEVATIFMRFRENIVK